MLGQLIHNLSIYEILQLPSVLFRTLHDQVCDSKYYRQASRNIRGQECEKIHRMNNLTLNFLLWKMEISPMMHDFIKNK